MSHDARAIREALEALPGTCRYHGSDFGFLGWECDGGPPRCDSCKPAWRRAQALTALDRLITPKGVPGNVAVHMDPAPAASFPPPGAVLREAAAWERHTGRRLADGR